MITHGTKMNNVVELRLIFMHSQLQLYSESVVQNHPNLVVCLT